MKSNRLLTYLTVIILAVSVVHVELAHAKAPPGADLIMVRYSEDQGYAVLSPYELYLSKDGKSWRPVGLAQKNIRLATVVQGKDFSLVATESGKLFRISGGRQIQVLDPPRDPFGGRIRGLKTLTANADGTQILASPGLGVLISNNRGDSWEAVKDPFWSDPKARQVIGVGFAGDVPVVVTREGVYVRIKGKFELSGKGLPEVVRPTAAFSGSGRVLIALPGQGLYETKNGKSWKRLPSVRHDPLAFIGRTENGYLASGPFMPVYLSDKKGDQWERISKFSAGFVPASAAAVDPGAAIIFRGKGLMRLDEGVLSQMELPYNLATVYAILNLPGDLPGRQLAGTQAGVFYTEDGGLNWIDATPEMLGSPVSAFLQLSDGRILLASLGSGIFISTDGGVTWETWNHRLGTANVVRSLVEDKGGVLAATEKGLMWRAFGQREEWGPAQRGVPRLTVFRVIRSGDQIWCASMSGVYMAQAGGPFRIVNGLEGRATSIDEEDGRVIALVANRIFLRDTKGKIRELPELPGKVFPTAVALNRSATMVGTAQGLFQLKDGGWERVGQWNYPVQVLVKDRVGVRVVTRGAGTYRAP
jgi:photosystem II stability/assembly factor-like uncharacterized protein